jgi:hypothetical protein
MTQPEAPPDCSHVGLPNERPRRLAATTKDLATLLYALKKLLEKRFLHRYSFSTICRNVFF